MNTDEQIRDLELLVRVTMPGAVSLADLKEYYGNDPLTCAKELANNEQGLCGAINSYRFEIVEARVKP